MPSPFFCNPKICGWKKKKDRYQRGLASMVYRFFDLKTGSGAGPNVKDLAQELHKPVIKKF